MSYDNPAARLFRILSAGREASKNDSTRSVLAVILQCEPHGHLLLSKIGKMMELPSLAVEAMRRMSPPLDESLSRHWVSQFSGAMSNLNLDAPWKHFMQHLDEHSFTQLSLTAELLEARSPGKPISEEDLNKLSNQFDNLFTEIVSSDLPAELKGFLTRAIQKLRIALGEYRLSGAQGISDAVYAVTGESLWRGWASDARKHASGAKFFTLLEATASAATVADLVPRLAIAAWNTLTEG